MRRLAMVILWPSFLVAAMAEGFFFSLLDPLDLHLGGVGFALSPLDRREVGSRSSSPCIARRAWSSPACCSSTLAEARSRRRTCFAV